MEHFAAVLVWLLSQQADYPPLTDLAFLPTEHAHKNSFFNYHLAEAWQREQSLTISHQRKEQLEAKIRLARALEWDWLHLHLAMTEAAPEARRRHLQTLRYRIGPESYYAGRIHPAPWWCMEERGPR